MPQQKLHKIVPHLWYNREAVEAARFYAGLFPDSRVDRVTSLPTARCLNELFASRRTSYVPGTAVFGTVSVRLPELPPFVYPHAT